MSFDGSLDRQYASLDFDYVSSAPYRITLRRKIAQHVGSAPHGSFSIPIPTAMSIRLRFTGSVSDAPRSLTFTRSGTPRFCFTVRTGGLRKRAYRVTAYGPAAPLQRTASPLGRPRANRGRVLTALAHC